MLQPHLLGLFRATEFEQVVHCSLALLVSAVVHRQLRDNIRHCITMPTRMELIHQLISNKTSRCTSTWPTLAAPVLVVMGVVKEAVHQTAVLDLGSEGTATAAVTATAPPSARHVTLTCHTSMTRLFPSGMVMVLIASTAATAIPQTEVLYIRRRLFN